MIASAILMGLVLCKIKEEKLGSNKNFRFN
jgi:hypothetical protein